MKKKLLLASILILAFGCAQNYKISAYKAGVTEVEYNKDKYECVQQSRTSWSGGGSGLIGVSMMASAEAKANRQSQELYKMCMEARGYTVIEADVTTGSTGLALNQDLTVVNVTPGSPAEKAGVKMGDKVKSANGFQAKSTQDLAIKFPPMKVGEKRTYVFEREGTEFTVEMIAEPLSKISKK